MSSRIFERVLKYVRAEEIIPLSKPVTREETDTPSRGDLLGTVLSRIVFSARP
jgi:hypothetical protein